MKHQVLYNMLYDIRTIVSFILCCIFSIHTYAISLNIVQNEAGDLINQIDISKIEEIDSLTIIGDINGTDILVIRKMTNLKYLNIEEASIVNGGASYYEDYITSENRIGDYFFKDYTNLNEILLPKNITDIGNYAFYGMGKLQSITIPGTVTHLGAYAFSNCTELMEVFIGDAKDTLKIDSPSETFSNCPIKTLYLGKSISSSPFKNNKALTCLTIGSSVASICENAFYSCEELKSVYIEDGTTPLHFHDSQVFSSCPIETTYIGRDFNNSPFGGKKSITSLIFGENVHYICKEAFRYCTGLTSLDIPNNVTSIEESAFADCENLNAITFPSNIRLLGENAFGGCGSLTSVEIPNSVTSMGSNIFGGCRNLTSVILPNSISYIAESSFSGCLSLAHIDIPSSVTSIGSEAFTDSGLSSVIIPSGVRITGIGVFKNCTGLKSVTFLGNNTPIPRDFFYNCTGLTSIELPDSITRIGEGAFYNCSSITSIKIPSKVSTIERTAFWRCSSLRTIYMPNSLTSVDNGEFYNCGITDVKLYFRDEEDFANYLARKDISSVFYRMYIYKSKYTIIVKGEEKKTIIIPNSVTSIGGSAFRNSDIESIIFPSSLTSIGDYTFTGCNSLIEIYSYNTTPPEVTSTTFTEEIYNNATLYVPKGSKTLYWLHPYWENFANIVEMNEDISEKLAEALKEYEIDKEVYNRYLYYSEGEGQTFYQNALNKQDLNKKVASELIYEIDLLSKKLSEIDHELNLSDEVYGNYLKDLESIKYEIYSLQKQNLGYNITNVFGEIINNSKKPFSDYNDRLTQYKEQIDSATTNDELTAIISEINADANTMQSNYLIDIDSYYGTLVEIAPEYTRIGEELEKYRQQLLKLDQRMDEIKTGINDIMVSDEVVNVINMKGERMTIESSSIGMLPKGIYIIRRTDGSTKKVLNK